MASKRKLQSDVSSDAALAVELSKAEAHWQQQKLAARAAKAAAKDAKKAVKRLRKLLLASNEEKKSADAKTHRIAGTPEARPRPAKKRTTRPKPQNRPPVIELQQDPAEKSGAVPSGSEDGTQQ